MVCTYKYRNGNFKLCRYVRLCVVLKFQIQRREWAAGIEQFPFTHDSTGSPRFCRSIKRLLILVRTFLIYHGSMMSDVSLNNHSNAVTDND